MTIRGKTTDIFDLDKNTEIWRVFNSKHFLDGISKNELVLVKPRLWEDPFENYLQKAKFLDKIGKIENPDLQKNLLDNIYGQCWTTNGKETDITWRLYAPSPRFGIRVKTTVEKLLNSIVDKQIEEKAINNFFGAKWHILSYCIGKVDYEDVNEIIEWLSHGSTAAEITIDPSGFGPMRLLMIKRPEFEHEQEVRLLYREHNLSKWVKNDIIKFNVNISSIVDNILCDPRIDDSLFKEWCKIIRQSGYNGTISKSNLYSLPDYICYDDDY